METVLLIFVLFMLTLVMSLLWEWIQETHTLNANVVRLTKELSKWLEQN